MPARSARGHRLLHVVKVGRGPRITGGRLPRRRQQAALALVRAARRARRERVHEPGQRAVRAARRARLAIRGREEARAARLARAVPGARGRRRERAAAPRRARARRGGLRGPAPHLRGHRDGGRGRVHAAPEGARGAGRFARRGGRVEFMSLGRG